MLTHFWVPSSGVPGSPFWCRVPGSGGTIHVVFIRVIATVAFAGLALGQAAATGSVSGTVKDPYSGVIPGATVTLTVGGAERKAITNSEGVYRLEGLPPGKYSVKVGLAGFLSRWTDIEITAGRDVTWDVRLGLGSGRSQEPPSGPDPTDSELSRGVYEALLRYAFKGSLPQAFRVTSVSLVPPDIDDREWPAALGAVPPSVRAATRTRDAQRPVTLRTESLPSGGLLLDTFNINVFDSKAIPYSSFSRVFPTADQLGALVVFEHVCGSLCANGSYIWLRRVSTVNTWVIQAVHGLWVS